MSLRSQYWPSREERAKQAAAEKAEAERETGAAAEFVRTDGFRDLNEWLEAQLLMSEVTVSSPESMLTQVGFREGLRRVQSHLIELKKIARGENHV